MQNSKSLRLNLMNIHQYNREKVLAIFDEKIEIGERYKQRNNLNHVQTPWNSVDGFGIALNPNKGHSVSSQLDQTEPWYCRRIPSIFASLSHGFYSRSRARVALGRELQLPMSFPWPIFPGLDQDLFPPHGFPRFLGFDSKTVQRSALCRSRRELSNEYLLAKFGFDTAENEPFKVR